MRKLRTFMVWGAISLLLQIGFLFYLESLIKGPPVTAATEKKEPVMIEKTINLPKATISDLQASYSKDYLAYTDLQGLKVYNVKQGKSVFVEKKPARGEILSYIWLPDRNTLLFVTARPNPNPRPAPPKPKPAPPVTQGDGAKEDPNTKKAVEPAKPVKVTPTPYYNPQLTELYAVDFGEEGDSDAVPDLRLARKLDFIPVGAVVETMEVSTYTNLIYLHTKTPSGQRVYEIDVMKNVRTVSRFGEKISDLVVSDKNGTLYMQSLLAGISQVVVVKHNSREQLIRGNQYVLLGQADNKVLVGELRDNQLVRINSAPDTGNDDNLSTAFKTEWLGNIPWKNYSVKTGDDDFMVFYNNKEAVILEKGVERRSQLNGEDNYLTQDGREVMEVTNTESSTRVKIRPL